MRIGEQVGASRILSVRGSVMRKAVGNLATEGNFKEDICMGEWVGAMDSVGSS